MPSYAGAIKYPIYTDKYNTAYGEPQWWRDMATTTQTEIAAQVGTVANDVATLSASTTAAVDDLSTRVTTAQSGVDALGYNSGWRNVSSTLTGGASGNVFLAREGQVVHMMIHNMSFSTAGNIAFLTLPDGFRPTAVSGANWRNGMVFTDTGDTVRPLSYYVNTMRVLNAVTGKQFGGYVNYIVPPALPTALPGVPA